METYMIKIQSLKSTVIAHFAAILLPVIALSGYHTLTGAHLTANVDRVFQPRIRALPGLSQAITQFDPSFPVWNR
jgi:hypothetical protein